METIVIEDQEKSALYALLEETKPLRSSSHPIVSVAAERIVALLVDTLYEVDLEMADPWQHLADAAPVEEMERGTR